MGQFSNQISSTARKLYVQRRQAALTTPSLSLKCAGVTAATAGTSTCWLMVRDPDGDKDRRENITEIAFDGLSSTDPKQRWAGIRCTIMSSMIRGTTSGAPQSETQGLLEALILFDEMAEGNFTNPVLPITRGVGKSVAVAQVYAGLAVLIKANRCTTASGQRMSLPKACAAVEVALDELLAEKRYSLRKWLNASTSVAGRMKTWIENRDIPTQELPAFTHKYALLDQILAIAGPSALLASFTPQLATWIIQAASEERR